MRWTHLKFVPLLSSVHLVLFDKSNVNNVLNGGKRLLDKPHFLKNVTLVASSSIGL